MFFAQFGKDVQGAIPVFARLVRKHRGGIDQLAGGIDHGHFHARANARVQPHGHARAGRRCQQKIPQIVSKHFDGDFLGSFTQLGKQVALGRQAELDLPGPGDAFADQVVRRTAFVAPAQGQGNSGFGQTDRSGGAH